MDRAGPPTPRNEPWCGPDGDWRIRSGDGTEHRLLDLAPNLERQALQDPEHMAERTHEAREAAFQAWAAQGLCVATAGERAFAKAVFCAGWHARKRAEWSVYQPKRRD